MSCETREQGQMSKEALLDWINKVSFAKDDTLLYLDTHPHDKEALAYFDEVCKMRKEALEEYSRLYGPLQIDTADTASECWEWINNPWPWDNV